MNSSSKVLLKPMTYHPSGTGLLSKATLSHFTLWIWALRATRLTPVYLRVVGVNKLAFLKLAAPRNAFAAA